MKRRIAKRWIAKRHTAMSLATTGRDAMNRKAIGRTAGSAWMTLPVWAVFLMITGLVLSASLAFGQVSTAADAPGNESGEVARVPVIVEPLERRDLARYVTYPGVLQPQTSVQLTMQVGGLVHEAPFDVGDEVEVGDVLLRLDTRDLEAQVRQAQAGHAVAVASLERLLSGATAAELAQARAALAQAEVQHGNAQIEFDRTERLFQSGSVSRQAYDSAASQLEIAKSQLDSAKARLAQVQRGASPEEIAVAEAQVQQAQASLDLAVAQLEKATLRSPVSGVISQRAVQVGETVTPGAPVLTVVDLSELSLSIRALGQDVIRLQEGMSVDVTVEDDPAQRFTGRLHRINPVADLQTNLFPVEVRLTNADGRLRAGFYASAQLQVASAANVLAAPERAIVRRDGVEGIYHVVDGHALFVPVQFGMSDGRAWREVVSAQDLDEGALVITSGKEYVTHDMPVQTRRE